MSVGVGEPTIVADAEAAGFGLEERLRAVEATGSGTKADLEAVKTLMERHFNRLLRWGLGIMITATGALSALIFGILRTTGN